MLSLIRAWRIRMATYSLNPVGLSINYGHYASHCCVNGVLLIQTNSCILVVAYSHCGGIQIGFVVSSEHLRLVRRNIPLVTQWESGGQRAADPGSTPGERVDTH